MAQIRLAAALPGGLPRSRYWTFKASPNSRNLYVSREGMGEWAHISLHGDRDWHVGLSHENLDVGVAPEIVPGVRHALSIVIAPSACTISADTPSRARVIQLRDEMPLRCGSLDVFLVDRPDAQVMPGASEVPTWRESLGPDDASVQIFARAVLVPTIEFEIEGPRDKVRSAIEEVEAGTADGLQVLRSNGGPVVILDGRLAMP